MGDWGKTQPPDEKPAQVIYCYYFQEQISVLSPQFNGVQGGT